MPFDQRQEIFRKIEEQRNGRTLVSFFDFDRESNPPVPGMKRQFHSDTKEALFRVLKESVPSGGKIDLCVYTRGGDTNSVWPLVSIIREFDPDFEVLIPFRCHSSGTLLALGAKVITMPPMGELSPIDPSTGNQFNPSEPGEPRKRLAISVEDVQAFRRFLLEQLAIDESEPEVIREQLSSFLGGLATQVHPLALGNVHRVLLQIKQLASKLLQLHDVGGSLDVDEAVEALTTRFYSHLHMVNRHEAREILGEGRINFASDELANTLDDLLRVYEDDFKLREPFFLAKWIQDDLVKDARFIGGVVESSSWSYLFETNATVRQSSAVPPNVQLQLPAGQPVPIIPGLPREYNIEVTSQRWMHNTGPQGITA